MLIVARKELRDALRNHWLQGYAALLGVLGWVLAIAAARSASGLALQTFGRTSASLVNLSLLLAPLVALTLGALAIAGERERGTLERLLAQPLERRELLLGKYLGLLISMALATVVGFAPALLVVGGRAGTTSLVAMGILCVLVLAVVAALLAVGVLLSVESRGAGQAQSRALFAWFAFVLLYDLVLMGTVSTVSLSPWALALLMGANPVSAGRLLAMLALGTDLHLLGPAGAWLVNGLGTTGAASLLTAVVLLWGIGALALAVRRFRLRRPPQASGPLLALLGLWGRTPRRLPIQRVRS